MTIWSRVREPVLAGRLRRRPHAGASATRTSVRATTRNTENVLRKLLGVRDLVAPRGPARDSAETASRSNGEPRDVPRRGARTGRHVSVRGVHAYPARPGRETPARTSRSPAHVAAAPTRRSPRPRPAPTIVAGVHAQSVNLVLASATGQPVDAIVQLDGKPVPADGARRERPRRRRRADRRDRDRPRHVPARPRRPTSKITSSASRRASPGLEAYSFTFG